MMVGMVMVSGEKNVLLEYCPWVQFGYDAKSVSNAKNASIEGTTLEIGFGARAGSEQC
jgi:hypothetical protein